MIAALDEEFEAYQYSLESSVWQESLPTFQFYASENVSSTPKVSVIIANFNNESYLNNMMDSLVQQTIGLEQLQIMFIDDKSTDDSLEIIRPYVEHYQSIEVYALDQNTGGAHGPRNVGILNARGDYLVFLDSDDWYDLDALRYLSQLLDASGDDFAVSGLVQSRNGEISLKSKPYFYDGDFKNRSIQDLPAEFYGWLGPQAIMLRRSLVIENKLHFVNQRVADDVTFFYEAMRFAKTITQGKELTTYLNRDADNVSLSKSINRQFMISWLRALSYINMTFPDDVSKERFLARRIEWLIQYFVLRPNIAYKFGKHRMRDFKEQLDYYLPNLSDDLSQYFKVDTRKNIWCFLQKNDLNSLYKFVLVFFIRHILYIKFHLKKGLNYKQIFPNVTNSRITPCLYSVKKTQTLLRFKLQTSDELLEARIMPISNPMLSQTLNMTYFGNDNYEVQLPQVMEKSQVTLDFKNYHELKLIKLEQLK